MSVERPAYSITLEDMGAQVQWTVESDLTTVAEGVVPIDTWEGRSLPARLSRAFDRAYATSEAKRAELLNRDLEVAAQEAEWAKRIAELPDGHVEGELTREEDDAR